MTTAEHRCQRQLCQRGDRAVGADRRIAGPDLERDAMTRQVGVELGIVGMHDMRHAVRRPERPRQLPERALVVLTANGDHFLRLPELRFQRADVLVDLVILDELGYLGLGPGGPLLFQFCAERYERGSILITTNLDFARWTEVFTDATLTTALLDRLTHHAHILLFQGESYRFKESKQHRQEVSPATP